MQEICWHGRRYHPRCPLEHQDEAVLAPPEKLPYVAFINPNKNGPDVPAYLRSPSANGAALPDCSGSRHPELTSSIRRPTLATRASRHLPKWSMPICWRARTVTARRTRRIAARTESNERPRVIERRWPGRSVHDGSGQLRTFSAGALVLAGLLTLMI
jgi:hypothetical protein